MSGRTSRTRTWRAHTGRTRTWWARAAVRDRRARAGGLAAVGLAALAAGCGIPTTGVVEAGEPASGIHPLTSLYFVLPDGSLAVSQHATGGLNGVPQSIGLLLEGVGPAETKAMGLSTRLPLPTRTPEIRIGAGTVTVDVHALATRLSPTAVDQLVCTAAAAYRATRPGAGRVRVSVTLAGRPQAGSGDQSAVCSHAATSWSFPAGPPGPTYKLRSR
jgi:hypothetical protein